VEVIREIITSDLCASQGENFSFTDENGLQWSGTCSMLRMAVGGTLQIEGVVRIGEKAFVDQTILLQSKRTPTEVILSTR
jgi:hypothetical protein